MDDVVQDEAAKGGCAWKGENGFSAGLQREDLFQILVARLSNGGAGGSDVLVEVFEELFAGGHDGRLSWGSAGRTKIDRLALKGEGNERRQFDKMSGESAHGHGFIVGFPIGVGFGHAFESFSGGAHFVIEFRQESIADCHW